MDTHNILYSTGIVAYFKGSLEFSIIGGKLLLQHGAAYDEKGNLLQLTKQSYEVLDNIDLLTFENHKRYYLYLASEHIFNTLVSEDFLTQKKLEEDIYFFIATQQYNRCILLGEITIDYDVGNAQGVQSIGIPYNTFMAGKNEIDLKNIYRHSILPSPITKDQKDKIAGVLLDFSKTLYHKMIKNNMFSLSAICQAFFQFSDCVSSESLSPEELYTKFKNHINLFSWLEYNAFTEEEVKQFKKIEGFFAHDFHLYKTSFYHIDIDNPENLFFHILETIQELTQALQHYHVEKKDYEKENTEEIPEIHLSEDLSLEPFVSENVTLVEETLHEEDSTILLGGERDTYIQVGRGSQSGNDIIIGENDKTVSRIHLKITAHKQGFFIEDLSSMGTYVDDKRIEKNVKKFVTSKSKVVLGKKNCILDLYDYKIQALLQA